MNCFFSFSLTVRSLSPSISFGESSTSRERTEEISNNDDKDEAVVANSHLRWSWAACTITCRRLTSLAVGALILFLSYPVVMNIFSPNQVTVSPLV